MQKKGDRWVKRAYNRTVNKKKRKKSSKKLYRLKFQKGGKGRMFLQQNRVSAAEGCASGGGGKKERWRLTEKSEKTNGGSPI